MSTPIINAFPPKRRPGRGNIVAITDHGRAAGKQRYGLQMKSAAGKVFFNTYPERFATPGGLTANLQAVHKCITELLSGKANVIHVTGEVPKKARAKKPVPVAPPAAPLTTPPPAVV